MSRTRTWGPWALLAVVVAVGLGIGTSHSGPPPSVDQQVRAISSEVRCPSCSDLNAAQSNDVTAVAVRAAIRQRLLQGQSRSDIEAFLVSRYGPDILLRPPTSGIGGLVWALPLGAVVVGVAAAGWALRRWRRSGVHVTAGRRPDDDESALVRRALDGPG